MVPPGSRLDASALLTEHGRARVARDPGLQPLFAVLDACRPDRFPSELEAARLAHYSVATLKRHLRDTLGLSYRDLKERLLMGVAARSIADPRVPIKTAARSLG